MDDPTDRPEGVTDHLRVALEAIEDAEAAALFVRPDRARDAVRRGHQAATAALRDALQAADPAAAPTPRRDDGGEDDDMHRRHFAQLVAVVASAVATPGRLDRLAELSDLLASPTMVDVNTVQALTEITSAYADAYYRSPPADLARLTHTHLNTVSHRLDSPMTSRLRARLGVATAEAAALAGWVAFLLDRRGDARAYFAMDRDAAREADDATLQALALASTARLHSQVNRDGLGASRPALRLLEQAAVQLPAHASPTAAAWVHGDLAIEQAALGMASEYDATVQRMQEHMARERTEDTRLAGIFSETANLTFWGADGPGVARVIGLGGALLGRLGSSAVLADGALNAKGTARSTFLADLATAHVARGDVDQAVTAATDALTVVAARGYTSRVERLRGLRRTMPDATPGVEQLDDLLAAV